MNKDRIALAECEGRIMEHLLICREYIHWSEPAHGKYTDHYGSERCGQIAGCCKEFQHPVACERLEALQAEQRKLTR